MMLDILLGASAGILIVAMTFNGLPYFTLRQQVRAECKRRDHGWENLADELGDMAVEITGSNWPLIPTVFEQVASEIFRNEG